MISAAVRNFLGNPQPDRLIFILGRNPLWPNQKLGEPIVVPYDEEGVRTFVQQGLGPATPFGAVDPSDLVISSDSITPQSLGALVAEKDIIVPVGGKPALTENPFGNAYAKQGLFNALGIEPPIGFYQEWGPPVVLRSHPIRGHMEPKPRHVLVLQETGKAFRSEVGPTGVLTTDHTAFFGHNVKQGGAEAYLLFVTPGHGSGQAMLAGLEMVLAAHHMPPKSDFLAVLEFSASVDRGREVYAPTHIRHMDYKGKA